MDKPTKHVLDKKIKVISEALKDVKISPKMRAAVESVGELIRRKIAEASKIRAFKRRLFGIDVSDTKTTGETSGDFVRRRIRIAAFEKLEFPKCPVKFPPITDEVRRAEAFPGLDSDLEHFKKTVCEGSQVPSHMIRGEDDDQGPGRQEADGDGGQADGASGSRSTAGSGEDPERA